MDWRLLDWQATNSPLLDNLETSPDDEAERLVAVGQKEKKSLLETNPGLRIPRSARRGVQNCYGPRWRRSLSRQDAISKL